MSNNLFINGIGIRMFDGFQAFPRSLDETEYTQCGRLIGYRVGEVYEGSFLLPCLSAEDYFSWQTILTAVGRSWCLNDVSSTFTGSDGVEATGTFTPTAITDDYANTVDIAALTSAANFPGINDMFTTVGRKWVVMFRDISGTTPRTYVINGTGSAVTETYLDGVSIGTGAGPGSISGDDFVIATSTNLHSLSMYNGTHLTTSVQMHASVTQDGYDACSPMPYVSISGQDMKREVKAFMRLSSAKIEQTNLHTIVVGFQEARAQ